MQSAFFMNLFACSSPICLAFGSGLDMMLSLCTTIVNDAVSDIWCTRCLCQLEHPLQDRSTLGHVLVRHSATPQRSCMLLLSFSDRFSIPRGLRPRPVSVQIRVSVLLPSARQCILFARLQFPSISGRSLLRGCRLVCPVRPVLLDIFSLIL